MKKGFTLIELMIVVVIIGILAAIAIPNFVQIIDKAKISSVKANMHTAQVTVETKAVDLGGAYCVLDSIASGLPQNFKNPYASAVTGVDAITALDAEPTDATDGAETDEGQVGYYTDAADIDGTTYSIVGFGKAGKSVKLLLVPGTTE